MLQLLTMLSLQFMVKGFKTIGVLGIVAGALVLVLLILGILHRKGCLGGKASAELHGLDLQTGLFTLRWIKAATKDFDPANKLGEGEFGSFYKVLNPIDVLAGCFFFFFISFPLFLFFLCVCVWVLNKIAACIANK